MARKVAHEIKNPLTPIAVSVADLRRSYEQQRPDFGEILAQAVRTIDEEVRIAPAACCRSSPSSARFPPRPVRSLRPRRTAGRPGRALRAARPARGASCSIAVASRLVLDADRGQLRQALVNLVQNALDATAGGGVVRVAGRVESAWAGTGRVRHGPGPDARAGRQSFRRRASPPRPRAAAWASRSSSASSATTAARSRWTPRPGRGATSAPPATNREA